jgi:prepilin signal peptidase PulO-like enzyme (type II secretory pathway)
MSGSAWAALGFVLGVGAGVALAASLAGRSISAGRRCRGCGASLSPWPRLPILSWFGTIPHCRSCGLATPRFPAIVEALAVLIGLAAIFSSPLPLAIGVALAGWAVLLLGALLWTRLR